MPKLSSFEDLDKLRERIRGRVEREQQVPRITMCAGTACQASGANDIVRVVKRYLMERDLIDRIALRITGCHGFCEMGPFLLAECPDEVFYPKITTQQVPRVIKAVLAGEYVEELLYHDPQTGAPCLRYEDIPFFKKQKRTLLRRNQGVDPIRLFNYIGTGGYGALVKALGTMTPEQVIEEVKRSGLRGRGGAGFLTGRKWDLARQQDGRAGKYVVCNADEGDPGAYMDQGILEGNPHSVVEGMIIGGLAMGATEGIIFVRHEYPLAIKHAIIALRLAREYGFLGEDILGSGFNFDINIVKSAGAFVCGEETALIRTIEGFVGEPRQRPPFPIERGVFGRPTCINNVETWANVPLIIGEGADAFASVGTANSTGTKVFSVVGKVKNTGLVEVPMGTSIKEIVYDIGGGPNGNVKIKAVQIGGPSGGCIPHWRFDLPIDYDSLTEAGAIMGSGGMIVMDERTCMVDVAKYFMGFLKDESCGKCLTCRKGTQRMYELLDDITEGRGTMEHLDLLQELGEVVKDASMCGLGQSAPNSVLSTLRYFRHEYERHIQDKRCDASVCANLVGAPCQSACPAGTEAWRYVAHIGRGEYEDAYRVIRAHNPLPSICARVCDHRCETFCRLGTTGEAPVAVRMLKRFVTDRVDPAVYEPERREDPDAAGKRIAVVGAGPAGLAAAHALSLRGYQCTVFEKESVPGGMLVAGIPSYRLPREVLNKEIEALIDENVTMRYESALGRDFTLESLFGDGFAAVFLATGAHESQRLGIAGEDAEGVYASMEFLKAWDLHGKSLARGRVGVIGGGNSAVDAARVALRQKRVTAVTIFYRRSREEMPAFVEEVNAALDEGVQLEVLVSPVAIHKEGERLAAMEFVRNDLGEVDTSGRRRPVPRENSQESVALETLVVAIGEKPGLSEKSCEGVTMQRGGTLVADPGNHMTERPGVFAGGDVVSGPATVIEAIAAGTRAGEAIARWLRGEPLAQEAQAVLPSVFVPAAGRSSRKGGVPRAQAPLVAAEERRCDFVEAEGCITLAQAQCEARRCLRCDLEFVDAPEQEGVRRASGTRA